jgi:hypothetical protein
MKGKNKTFKLISTIVGWATLGISVILAILFYIGIKNEQATASNIDLLMNWTLVMVILAVVVAFLIGPILSIITEPKNLAKSLISIGVLVVVVLLAYSFSSGDISAIKLNYTIDPEKLRKQLVFTETGLTTFYIMLGLTFVATLVAELKGLFKL